MSIRTSQRAFAVIILIMAVYITGLVLDAVSMGVAEWGLK